MLAVHTDHEHIHNHIVVNNVNYYSGKSFETEYNQGKIPDRAWAKLREVSDKICTERGLSVILDDISTKGKDHYEWEMDKQKLSWKSKLKYAIDQVVKVSEDFEDFLKKCEDFGILVDYDPDRVIDLKFMLAEQKERNPRAKFTRARTLGWFYESKQIESRIKNWKKYKDYKPSIKIIRTSTDKFLQSEGLTNWADRENMKETSIALNEMNASNSTLEELETAARAASEKADDLNDEARAIRSEVNQIIDRLPKMKEFEHYAQFHQTAKTLQGKELEKFRKKVSYELEQYRTLLKEVREWYPSSTVPTVKALEKRRERLAEEYTSKKANAEYLEKESLRLSGLADRKRNSQKTVQKYLENEQEVKRKKKKNRDVLE